MRKIFLTLAAALLLLSPLAHAADAPAPAFTDAQRAEIESIVKDYLTKEHPEVLAEGLQNLQKQEQDSADAKSKSAVNDAKARVFDDPNSPVGGNPKGDVTVVEFFDYQCPYCKASHKAVTELLKDDKNVRFIYKEFPILGPTSVTAAKAALASVKQGKYIVFQNALMNAPFSHNAHPDADNALIYQTAKDVGLNVDKLKKDMEDPAIEADLKANLKLGEDIGVRGTPMFIVGDNVYPGALQYDQLKQAVADARAAAKK
ncbi:MAG: DsbA family protein [Alphaproteobacteria bacterium]|nr:DsbA family protein [Alphaproteobacteria bacterium]